MSSQSSQKSDHFLQSVVLHFSGAVDEISAVLLKMGIAAQIWTHSATPQRKWTNFMLESPLK